MAGNRLQTAIGTAYWAHIFGREGGGGECWAGRGYMRQQEEDKGGGPDAKGDWIATPASQWVRQLQKSTI
jgi:hypothetical protein